VLHEQSNPSSDTLLLDSREAQAEASRELQLALDERVPLARAKSAPFFPPEIPDSLAVRADGPA
jgi:hypothetical protein